MKRRMAKMKVAGVVIAVAMLSMALSGLTEGSQAGATPVLASGNGLYAEYRELGGSEVILTVDGEGPIEHGWSWACYNAGQGYTIYQYECGLWAGRWDGWGIFEETLTGYLEAPQTGRYALEGWIDDYLEVTFEGETIAIVDTYPGGGYHAEVDLVAGQCYEIRLDFKNRWGSCNLNLYWTLPDGTHELVPKRYLYTEMPAPPVLNVAIDIKPGSFPNSINPRSRGKIPVAILTTGTFAATTVDTTTVRFGATGTEAAPVHSALEDIDGDGDTDMILHFNTQDTGIKCGDTSASLTGQTFSGQAIKGSDSIQTVGCR